MQNVNNTKSNKIFQTRLLLLCFFFLQFDRVYLYYSMHLIWINWRRAQEQNTMIARHAHSIRREIKDETADKIDVHCLLDAFGLFGVFLASVRCLSTHAFVVFQFSSFDQKKKKMIHTNSHTHTLARALCAFFLLSFVLFVCYWCHIKVIHATRLLIGQFHMHVEQWIKSGIRSAATSSIKRLFQKTLLDYIILFFYLLSIFGRSSFYRFPIFLSWFSFFYPSSFS